jgi:hypothetical protein
MQSLTHCCKFQATGEQARERERRIAGARPTGEGEGEGDDEGREGRCESWLR